MSHINRADSQATADAYRGALIQALDLMDSLLAGEADAEDRAQEWIEVTRATYFGDAKGTRSAPPRQQGMTLAQWQRTATRRAAQAQAAPWYDEENLE